MYVCPRCEHRLDRVKHPEGVFWRCAHCRGRAVAIPLLRRTHAAEYVNQIWTYAREEKGVRRRPCPACAQFMLDVPIVHGDSAHWLDVCTRCHFVWFDPGEFEASPEVPTAQVVEPEMPAEARRLMAEARAKEIRARMEPTYQRRGEGGQGWEILAAMLGLPVEDVQTRIQTRPALTWSLVGIVTLVSMLAFGNRGLIEQFAFVPADAFRHAGLTFLTPFFLHGGLMHLVGNMYFLLIFGDNVEDFLGRWKYALLLALATVAGNILHLMGNVGSEIPCVGASGGISGVIAFYALQFPQARIGLYIRMGFYYPRRMQLTAWMAFLLWLGMQFLLTLMQMQGLTNVSALAHLGGAAVGLAVWGILKVSGGRG
jgi:membrane associated rhomboid family serine protease/Zn-finger nucleic acid-binding protein